MESIAALFVIFLYSIINNKYIYKKIHYYRAARSAKHAIRSLQAQCKDPIH